MVNPIRLLMPFVLIFFIISHVNAKNPKIVGLVAARNESALIANCLRALAQYADAIVVLDDASTDNTVAIIKSLQAECRIQKIITKKEWHRHERSDKNALLSAGREVGGTHFIMLDADEMFVATCKHNNWLRNRILEMKSGQVMYFPMMNVWGSHTQYRSDNLAGPRSPKFRAICGVVCDDGLCDYNQNPVWGVSGTIHVNRRPSNLKCTEQNQDIYITDLDKGMFHFKFVNLKEVAIKKVWYMCLEFIEKNKRTTQHEELMKNAELINKFYEKEFSYAPIEQPELIQLAQVPQEWYSYSFFDSTCYKKLFSQRKNEILAWINMYGKEYFKYLNIWDIDWLQGLNKC